MNIRYANTDGLSQVMRKLLPSWSTFSFFFVMSTSQVYNQKNYGFISVCWRLIEGGVRVNCHGKLEIRRHTPRWCSNCLWKSCSQSTHKTNNANKQCQYSCLKKFHGQRNLAGYGPGEWQRVRHDWVTNTHTHIPWWHSSSLGAHFLL